MREFDDEHFALSAAIAGHGLVLASNVLVADSVKRGELVAYRPEISLPGPRRRLSGQLRRLLWFVLLSAQAAWASPATQQNGAGGYQKHSTAIDARPAQTTQP